MGTIAVQKVYGNSAVLVFNKYRTVLMPFWLSANHVAFEILSNMAETLITNYTTALLL